MPSCHNAGYGTLHCLRSMDGCPGAGTGTYWANRCHPYHVWSGTEGSSAGIYKLAELVSGIFSLKGACSTGECIYTITGTVRCVLDMNLFKLKSHKGSADSSVTESPVMAP